MISFRTQCKLANLIQTIALGEKQSEIKRQVLAEQIEFEPHTAFRRIDTNRDQFITQSEIQDFLEVNNITISSQEAYHLFNVLDYNDDGIIDYQDFQDAICPQENMNLKSKAMLRESYYMKPYEKLPYEVEWSLVRVLEQEVENFRKLKILRETLQTTLDFDTIECFNAIDTEKLGFLYSENIDIFLMSTQYPLSPDEIQAFIRVVGNYELQKITYSQFSQFLNPLRIPSKQFYSTQQTQRYISPMKNSYYNYTSPKMMVKLDDDYFNYLNKSAIHQIEQSRKSRYEYSPSSNYKSQLLNTSTNASSYHRYQTPDSKLSYSMRKSPEKISPMKGNEEEQLVKALQQMIRIDREIEEIKQKLAQKTDFNLFDAFQLFDYKQNGRITKLETQKSLNDMGIYPNDEEMYLLFKFLDNDNDLLIRYAEFVQAILPKDTLYAKILKDRISQFDQNDQGIYNFEFDTRYTFKQLLIKMIDGVVEADRLRSRLNQRPMFTLTDAFSAIDSLDQGFVTQYEFKQILNEYGIFVQKQELQQLMSRFDKDQDGKVSYKEFIQEMTPQSPYKSEIY